MTQTRKIMIIQNEFLHFIETTWKDDHTKFMRKSMHLFFFKHNCQASSFWEPSLAICVQAHKKRLLWNDEDLRVIILSFVKESAICI